MGITITSITAITTKETIRGIVSYFVTMPSGRTLTNKLLVLPAFLLECHLDSSIELPELFCFRGGKRSRAVRTKLGKRDGIVLIGLNIHTPVRAIESHWNRDEGGDNKYQN
jgi:hypothetical protein